MVNDTGHAVLEGEGGQHFGLVEGGAIHITVVHGEVVRPVVAAAGSAQALHTGLVDGELGLKSAVVGDVPGAVVGDGVAAAPIAVGIVIIRELMCQTGVVVVAPGVGCVHISDTGAVGTVEQLASILRIVDQAGPVALAGEVGAALVVPVLEGQNLQVVIRCCSKHTDRQKRNSHDERQQKG